MEEDYRFWLEEVENLEEGLELYADDEDFVKSATKELEYFKKKIAEYESLEDGDDIEEERSRLCASLGISRFC